MKLFNGVIAAVCITALGQASAADTPGDDYLIYVVTRDAIPVTLSFAGTVSADKTLQLTAQMPGRVADIAGEEGDEFAAGTVLVELEDSALLARREAALASRDAAAAEIRNARVQLDRERFSPRSNAANTAPGGMGMPAMMDQVFANPMQNMMGMRSRGADRTSDLVSMETQLAQATTRLKTAEANIREVDSRLRDTRGVAEFTGVIQNLHVEVGDPVQPGQPLLDFSESAALVVEADLPIRLSRTLALGQPLIVALGGDQTLPAPVSRIYPAADPRQNTVRIELTLPVGIRATPGQYVEIRVPDNAAGVPDQLVIPQSAIVTKGGLPLVFTVDRAGKARLRVVRLGDSPDGKTRVVLSGVDVGDRLIDQPPPGLRAGTQIVQPPTTPETAQNTE